MKLMMDYVLTLTHLHSIVHSKKGMNLYQQLTSEQLNHSGVHKIMNEYYGELESRFVYIHDEYFLHEASLIFDEFDIEMDKNKGNLMTLGNQTFICESGKTYKSYCMHSS